MFWLGWPDMTALRPIGIFSAVQLAGFLIRLIMRTCPRLMLVGASRIGATFAALVARSLTDPRHLNTNYACVMVGDALTVTF